MLAPRIISHDWIGDDDLGRMRTLHRMRTLARSQCHHRAVVTVARSVVSPSGSFEYRAQQIRDWCQRQIEFKNDPPGIELVYAPEYLARLVLSGQRLACDCDDVACFSACIGRSVGLSARFRAVAFLDNRRPYGHVFTEFINLDGTGLRVIDVDITRDAQQLPPCITRQVVVNV